MDSESITKAAHDLAPEIEEGLGSVLDSQATINEKIRENRSHTFASRTATVTSSFRKALTWTSSIGAAMRPNIPNSTGLTRVKTMEEFPMGYPRLSYVLNSDESFMMYRQFGQLHSRLLLYKQDQLRELEEELAALDHRDNRLQETQLYLRCRADDEDREPPIRGRTRMEVMGEIEIKLLEYGKLLKQAHKFQNMSRPANRDHVSVSNYIANEGPLAETDRDFVYWKEDLVTLRGGQQRAWLDAVLESALNYILRLYPSKIITYAFCTKESAAKTKDETFHYVDRRRVNLVVTFLISIILLPVVIAPVYLLYWLTVERHVPVTNPECIAILLVSGFVFSLGLGVFTQAKRHEILATVAGYCAVLVVFLSNPPGSGGNGGGGS